MKDFFDWYTAEEPPHIRNYWKLMDQYLFNIKILAVEMFNMKNGMPPAIIFYIFFQDGKWFQTSVGNEYNVRQQNDFSLPSKRTVYYGSQSLSHLDS